MDNINSITKIVIVNAQNMLPMWQTPQIYDTLPADHASITFTKSETGFSDNERKNKVRTQVR